MKAPLSPSKMPAMLPGVTAIWWEVNGYSGTLEPLQVVKETAKMVRTASLDSRGRVCVYSQLKNGNMHSTWAEAREAAMNRALETIERSRRSLALAQQVLSDLEYLKEPQP